jgi:hypothetical protein
LGTALLGRRTLIIFSTLGASIAGIIARLTIKPLLSYSPVWLHLVPAWSLMLLPIRREVVIVPVSYVFYEIGEWFLGDPPYMELTYTVSYGWIYMVVGIAGYALRRSITSRMILKRKYRIIRRQG